MDTQLATTFLDSVIKLIGGFLLTFLTIYVKQRWTYKQVQTSKSIAQLSVNFADELQRTLGIKGQDKLNAAVEQAKLQMGKFGVKLNDEQWAGLIKSVLNESRSIWDSVQGDTGTSQSPSTLPDPINAPLQDFITQAVQSQIQQVAQDTASKAVQDIINKTIQDTVKQATQPTP